MSAAMMMIIEGHHSSLIQLRLGQHSYASYIYSWDHNNIQMYIDLVSQTDGTLSTAYR